MNQGNQLNWIRDHIGQDRVVALNEGRYTSEIVFVDE